MSNLLASELYAISQSTKCEGSYLCHWCGAACRNTWLHDDEYPIPFNKSKTTAKYPNNLYVCIGCWLFRRKRVTVNFLNGELKDGQVIMSHSWIIVKSGCNAIRKQDFCETYEELLDPPLVFSLSLVEDKVMNHIQLGVVNELTEIKANTPLLFTLNNIIHQYTIYEIEQAMKTSELNGKEPGVSALLRFFGNYAKEAVNAPKRKRGRPFKTEVNDGRVTTKIIK